MERRVSILFYGSGKQATISQSNDFFVFVVSRVAFKKRQNYFPIDGMAHIVLLSFIKVYLTTFSLTFIELLTDSNQVTLPLKQLA
jgi:hypothetical protein